LIKEISISRNVKGAVYQAPMARQGVTPWVSLHETAPYSIPKDKNKPLANRGIVIRSWNARLGGQEASPWIAILGSLVNGNAQVELQAPPTVTALKPGDYVDGLVDFVCMPSAAKDYYGPNKLLKTALAAHEDSWHTIYREAKENCHEVKVQTGKLLSQFPAVSVLAKDDAAELLLSGGVSQIPLTIRGLSTSRGYRLTVDGKPLSQSQFGNDYWQTDYDPKAKTWSATYNVPITDTNPHRVSFSVSVP
jgi:hypothetical protein